MSEFIVAIFTITLLIVTIFVPVWIIISIVELPEPSHRRLIKKWNLFGTPVIIFKLSKEWVATLITKFSPKFDIDKEIAYERKVNKQLTAQKVKIAQLAIIKEENEALLEEVETEDYRDRTGPHFKHCPHCRNAYFGDYCDCLDKNEDVVYPTINIKGQTTEEAGKEHTRAMRNLSGYVEVKRNGEWSQRDECVYPISLQWFEQDGKTTMEIGFTDNTEQVFHEGTHDLELIEHLFRERKPIIEEEVRL